MVCYEKDNDIESYYHFERAEANRIIAVLKVIKELDSWTPLSELCNLIGSNARTMLPTIRSLATAKRLDVKMDGKRVTVAKHPIIFIRKDKYNNRNNLRKYRYLRPTVYVKRPHKNDRGAT